METKANYLLNAFLIVLVVAGVVGFVNWFRTNSIFGAPAIYQIVFQTSVGGLRKGAEVQFNGMKVGEVIDVQLDQRNWKQVVATISITSDAPVRRDTRVRVAFGTITGVAWIELRGGSPNAGPPLEDSEGVATLTAGPDATEGLTGAAHKLIAKLDNMVADTSPFHQSLNNIETFSASIKHNSGRFQEIIAAMGTLTGSTDKPGELADALKSVELLKENFNKQIEAVSPGIDRLTTWGPKNIDALMADARRAIATGIKVFKNIGQNPTRLLFGGGPPPQPAPTPRSQGAQ
jgi:phospholipid/cholesterol/gamma-HCH transport system substrate-binding protein